MHECFTEHNTGLVHIKIVHLTSLRRTLQMHLRLNAQFNEVYATRSEAVQSSVKC